MIRRKSKEIHPNARAARTENSARFAEHVDGIWCGRRDRHRLHGFRLLVALAGKFVAVLGGSDFKIISFCATPGKIQRGDTVDMCYGVSNAKAVKLEPPVANVWPSVDRCIQVAPKKTTTYTFTADDGKGNAKTAQLTIEVH